MRISAYQKRDHVVDQATPETSESRNSRMVEQSNKKVLRNNRLSGACCLERHTLCLNLWNIKVENVLCNEEALKLYFACLWMKRNYPYATLFMPILTAEAHQPDGRAAYF